MAARTISILKFVGTITLGISTGISTSLTALALPSLLALPTATDARTSLNYLTTKSTHYTSYLRHITTFTLFSAYLLSPRRYRHPYLLYTSILAFVSGPGIDYALSVKKAGNEQRGAIEMQEQAGEFNGETVRVEVERMRWAERVKGGIAGLAFAVSVVGLWGDGL